MKHFLCLLIVLLAIISCKSIVKSPIEVQYTRVVAPNNIEARHIPVFIDNSFGGEYKLGIDDAISRWNYSLNGYVVLDVKSSTFNMNPQDVNYVIAHHGLIITPVDSYSYPNIPEPDKKGYVTLAWANISTRSLIYVVRNRVPTQDVFSIMLHEIGHILGASHTDSFGLMYPTYTPTMYACIDSQTLMQVASFYHLPFENLNYCKYIF